MPKSSNFPMSKNISIEDSLSMFVNSWIDYKKIHEAEVEKREYINAQKEISLERIRSQRYIIEQYLTHTFRERQQIISGMFDALDKGIDAGNDQAITTAMNAIIATVQTSPLHGVKEILHQLNDESVDCIEI